ncbi:hypothetical protein ANRL1_03169 [Anaerolineae bacterium]|nr:hypothetical protein ANRL1_03169 [Anaerolineae bacterium]
MKRKGARIQFDNVSDKRQAIEILTQEGMCGLANQFDNPGTELVFDEPETAASALSIIHAWLKPSAD